MLPMRFVSIFLVAIANGVVSARYIDTRSPSPANQAVVEGRADWNPLSRRYYHRSSREHQQTHNGLAKGRHDYDKLQARSAKATPVPLAEANPNLLAGLKKTVSGALQKHGPNITKFAHTALQKQLSRFIGPKQKGKNKGDKKGKKDGDKNADKNSNEKESSKKTRDLFESQAEPAGPGTLAKVGNHLLTHREEYLDTLMQLHGMVQQGAMFLEPERMLMGYD